MITVTVALPCCCCCCCCCSQQLLLLFIFIARGFAYWLSLKLTATCTLGLAAASFDASSSEMLQLASPWIFLLIFIEFFFFPFFCFFFCFFFWGCLLKTSVNLPGISRVYSSELFTQRVLCNKNENYARGPSRGIQMEFEVLNSSSHCLKSADSLVDCHSLRSIWSSQNCSVFK